MLPTIPGEGQPGKACSGLSPFLVGINSNLLEVPVVESLGQGIEEGIPTTPVKVSGPHKEDKALIVPTRIA